MSAHDEAHPNNVSASTERSELPAGAARGSVLPFPVVGVGASAGGLDAFKTLLAALPAETGMAFILIQHLDPSTPVLWPIFWRAGRACPSRKRSRASRLSRTMSILFRQRFRSPFLTASCILPSQWSVMAHACPSISSCVRSPRSADSERLASCCPARARWQRGPEGDQGQWRVRSGQDPLEAQFDGMPKSAIGTGMADVIAPVAAIPRAIVKRATYLFHGGEISCQRERCDPARGNPRARQNKTAHDFTGLQDRDANPPDRAPHGGRGHGGRGPLC